MPRRLLPAVLFSLVLIQEVVVIRRVSCSGARVVKRFKPRRNGTFTLPQYVDIG
jgi:hypothetical protein